MKPTLFVGRGHTWERKEMTSIFKYLIAKVELPKSNNVSLREWNKSRKVKVKKKIRRFKAKHPKVWKYREYIKSKAWERRRHKYFKKHKKECAVCGSQRGIGLHHVNYERVGNELDTDLVPLCWVHHKEYHEQHQTKRNMNDETFTFINEEREIRELREITKNFDGH